MKTLRITLILTIAMLLVFTSCSGEPGAFPEESPSSLPETLSSETNETLPPSSAETTETGTEPATQPESLPATETTPAPETTPETETTPEPESIPILQPEPAPTTPAVSTNVADPSAKKVLAGIPIANASMSEAALRQICVDFMRLQLSFSWTPDQNLSYVTGGNTKTLEKGRVYGGLPYISSHYGNLYRALDYYDSRNGMIEFSKINADWTYLVGNQCSSSAYWAWARVSNQTKYGGTSTALQKNGCYRLGTYTYSDQINNFHSERIRTADICKANTKQTMFESYALVQPADGLVRYVGTAGHIVMASYDAVVFRLPDGSIDGANSYLTLLEQVSSFKSQTQSNGISLTLQGGVDNRFSFNDLYQSGYLPFVIAEFCGKDPVEPGEASIDLTGEAASLQQLKDATVSANYPISHIIISCYEKSGAFLGKKTIYANGLNLTSMPLSTLSVTAFQAYGDQAYWISVSAMIGTGQTLPLWSGRLL